MGDDLLQYRERGGPVALVDQLDEGRPQELVWAEPEHALHGGALEGDLPAFGKSADWGSSARDEHHVGGMLHERAKARLALTPAPLSQLVALERGAERPHQQRHAHHDQHEQDHGG